MWTFASAHRGMATISSSKGTLKTKLKKKTTKPKKKVSQTEAKEEMEREFPKTDRAKKSNPEFTLSSKVAAPASVTATKPKSNEAPSDKKSVKISKSDVTKSAKQTKAKAPGPVTVTTASPSTSHTKGNTNTDTDVKPRRRYHEIVEEEEDKEEEEMEQEEDHSSATKARRTTVVASTSSSSSSSSSSLPATSNSTATIPASGGAAVPFATRVLDKIYEVCKAEAGEDIMVIDISQKTNWVPYMVIVTGMASRHCVAIAEQVKKQLKLAGLVRNARIERNEGDEWVIVNTGTVVVEILTREQREDIDLERLWVLKKTIQDTVQFEEEESRFMFDEEDNMWGGYDDDDVDGDDADDLPLPPPPPKPARSSGAAPSSSRKAKRNSKK
jgi:ribosome silencing factor RsfS/YbeB/iojap